MAPKKMSDTAAPTPDPESFLTGYASWDSPRFQGRQKQVDRALSETRGMQSRSGLPAAKEKFDAQAGRPTNKQAVRDKAAKQSADVDHLLGNPDVQDRPTRAADIANRYSGIMASAVQRGHDEGTNTPGAGWYFDQVRQQKAHLEPGSALSSRQMTAMGAKLSAGKTPEDESVAMGGISRLTGSLAARTVDGSPLRDHSSEEIGQKASAAAAWGSYEGAGRRGMPDAPKPQADDETFAALRDAGRAHAANTSAATAIARGTMSPKEGFGVGTPKTRAYGEMQAQSEPGSLAETDYRNVTKHYSDLEAGKQIPGQGMMMFSQDAPGPRHHTLGSSTPTAIDTWMVAAGTGQPLTATHPGTGRAYSPAKRMADKMMPHDMSGGAKGPLGLIGTDVSAGEAISAQHNEAIRLVSEKHIGAISHDQFGQNVHVPASHIQEAVWTESRRQAGWDPEFNAVQRDRTSQARTAEKSAVAGRKANGVQQTLKGV